MPEALKLLAQPASEAPKGRDITAQGKLALASANLGGRRNKAGRTPAMLGPADKEPCSQPCPLAGAAWQGGHLPAPRLVLRWVRPSRSTRQPRVSPWAIMSCPCRASEAGYACGGKASTICGDTAYYRTSTRDARCSTRGATGSTFCANCYTGDAESPILGAKCSRLGAKSSTSGVKPERRDSAGDSGGQTRHQGPLIPKATLDRVTVAFGLIPPTNALSR
jgi:hypothetical protein